VDAFSLFQLVVEFLCIQLMIFINLILLTNDFYQVRFQFDLQIGNAMDYLTIKNWILGYQYSKEKKYIM